MNPDSNESVPTPLKVFQKMFGSSFDESEITFDEQDQTSSGGDNDYWLLFIAHPKRLEPYMAECEDIIEALQLTFQEGEAFKAIWRKALLRQGFGKPGDSLIRNSEKVAHFGARMLAMDERNLEDAA